MHNSSRRYIGLLCVLAGTPSAAVAQRGVEEEARWFTGFPNWSITLYGGLANQGRFLLQSVNFENDPNEQRELRADNAFSWGGAVGAQILPRTRVRLAFTRTSTELDYKDDTGTGSGLLDIDDVAGLSSNVLSLEALRFLLPERIRFTPYGGLGFAVNWWNLDPDDESPLIVAADGDDTQFRFAGSAVLGLQYRISAKWAARLEATTFSIGSPFTGNESYVPLTGSTIDEPTRVRQTSLRVSATYTFASARRTRARR